MVIDPLTSNTAAHRFYRRLGFVPVGRRTFGTDDCLVHRLDRTAWTSGPYGGGEQTFDIVARGGRRSSRVPRCDDPPRRPRRVLRLRGAAARPEPARAADRGRWRCRPRRVVRGEGARRPRGDGRLARPPAVPGAAVRGRSLPRVPAPGRRGDEGARRLHPAGRADLDRRGVPRRDRIGAPVRTARGDGDRDPPSRAVELGLPISVGVATTKHLAKVASQVAKPDGLVVVDAGTEDDFLDPLPVGLLWGVGPVTREQLASRGHRDDRCAGGRITPHVAAPPRPGERGEARRARSECRPAPHRDEPARPVDGRAVGARPPAGGRRGATSRARLPRRPGRDPPAREGAGRSDRHGAGARFSGCSR